MKWLAFFLTIGLVLPLHAAPPLRVLSYNIHHGEGTDRKLDLERLAKIIVESGADLVALQEVDVLAKRTGKVDQAKTLAELTKLHVAFIDAMAFDGGHYGGAILSRWPIIEAKKIELPQEQGREPRIAIQARIKPEGELPELLFVGTHFCHQSEATRQRQAAKLNEVLAEKAGLPIVLAGDFNAENKSETIKSLLVRWKDTADKAGVIDYIFVRSSDPWRVVETKTFDEPVASDHLPILTILKWQPGG